MPNTELCIKQGNRENDWWICTSNEAQNLHKLLAAAKKSGKKEKLVYENVNGDKVVLEGSNPDDVVLYKENEPSVKRMVIPMHAPPHKGFERPNATNKKATMSTRKQSQKVKRAKSKPKSKSTKRKSKKTRK
jgi:hypothetical protein